MGTGAVAIVDRISLGPCSLPKLSFYQVRHRSQGSVSLFLFPVPCFLVPAYEVRVFSASAPAPARSDA